MSDNVFPFGKFDPEHLRTGAAESGGTIAVINGIQHNLLLMLKKIDDLEQRIIQLENKNVE